MMAKLESPFGDEIIVQTVKIDAVKKFVDNSTVDHVELLIAGTWVKVTNESYKTIEVHFR